VSDKLVSGLTIIRNGVRLDYPFIEVIRSALPLCDEFIVVAGDSDDETLDKLAELDDPRIRIIHTHWSPWVTPRKCLLAQQTNIGLGLARGRWCLYLQGNEVLHEKDLPALRALMEEHAENTAVEALLFERLTFWADCGHYVAAYPRRHKYTARVVRPYIGTYSIRDGMSFAVFDGFSTRGRYPAAIDTGIDLYRYDYVHTVEGQARKYAEAVHRAEGPIQADAEYFYRFYPRQFIARFEGSHPAVMQDRCRDAGGAEPFELDRCRTALTPGERKRLLETWYYNRRGLPRSGRNRFRLIGDLKTKERPAMSALNGTLALD
jgi:glycosyltransferase involved in cell wall biosynthesis